MSEKKPNICVIGRLGFIGRECFSCYRRVNPGVLGTQHIDNRREDFFDLGLEVPGSFIEKLRGYTHAIIAAGISDPGFCEKHSELSYRINVEDTLRLAKILTENNIQPILFSSTYVFDGKHDAYKESSLHCPLNVYGKQKAILERMSSSNYLILRLGKLYSSQNLQQGFLGKLVQSVLGNENVLAAEDQTLSLLSIGELIRVIEFLINKQAKGLFNVCGRESVTRYSLVKMMVDRLPGFRGHLKKISLKDLKSNVVRPAKNHLDCSKLCSMGYEFSRESVDSLIQRAMEEIRS